MDAFADTLASLAESGNLRRIPDDTFGEAALTDFSSNDYLGLAADTALRENFLAHLDPRTALLSSSASRLLSACQNDYAALEQLLRDAYGRDALLFNSGYHANTGMIAALGGKDTLFVADKLVHASIVDGLVLSKSMFVRFRHNDMSHARRLIEKHGRDYERIVIVAESVYSMDGDTAPLDGLIGLKGLHPDTLLYVDEAHAVGVCGEAGLGLCRDRLADVDIMAGTFGKALASEGAFAVMSPVLREFMVNRCRSLIFSTALSPLQARWSAVTLRTAMGMDSARCHLRRLSALLHTGAGTAVDSHIQPLIVGDAARAVALSRRLLDDGLKVLPIRTPTVPPGSERLRMSLSAALGEDDIRRLIKALNKVLSQHN